MRRRATLAAVTAAALGVLLPLGAPGTTPAGVAAPAASGGTVLEQTLVLDWRGARYDGESRVVGTLPGIGTLTARCRRDGTSLRLAPYDRTRETQMWLAKHEVKGGQQVVAVKTARVYRWATRADDGRGGTGPTAAEGLNQRWPIEDDSTGGYAHGLVSQRPGRRSDAAGVPTPAPTSVAATWTWRSLRSDPDASSCRVVVRLRTDMTGREAAGRRVVDSARSRWVRLGDDVIRVGRTARLLDRPSSRLTLDWHGVANATDGGSAASAPLGDLGRLWLRCDPPDPADTGDPTADVTLEVPPSARSASVYVEQISGEGAVGDHVETYETGLDPDTGAVGPIALPPNGMLRLYPAVDLGEGSVVAPLVVSSYRVTNDREHPGRNLCEVAVGPWAD